MSFDSMVAKRLLLCVTVAVSASLLSLHVVFGMGLPTELSVERQSVPLLVMDRLMLGMCASTGWRRSLLHSR